MKIVCVGAGPAALCFAIRAKCERPDLDITILERARARESQGWGLVLSEGVLSRLESDDPSSGGQIRERAIAWRDISVEVDGVVTVVHGHKFLSLARVDMISIFQARAEDLGINIKYQTTADPQGDWSADADIVIAADGSRSKIRDADGDGFGVSVKEASNRYIWLGVPGAIAKTFRFIFETTKAGPIWAHSYLFGPAFTTFVIECPEATYRGLGFDRMDIAETVAICERIFARSLNGHPLLAGDAQRSAAAWTRFADIACASWVAGKTVLLGNAAHGTHFSIGSGTRIAIGDARELATRVVAMDGFDQRALKAYEHACKADSAKLHAASARSMRWFEEPPLSIAANDPDFFAYSLVTRSGRLGRAEIKKLDPALLTRVEARSLASRARG